jgi:hypothetical protein
MEFDANDLEDDTFSPSVHNLWLILHRMVPFMVDNVDFSLKGLDEYRDN